MFKKYINIWIYSNKIPFELDFAFKNGLIIQSKVVTLSKSCTTICLNCCTDSIKLIAHYQNQIQIKEIYLSKCICQNIVVGYYFYNQQNNMQYFTLYDRNYNIPISQAILNLSQN